MTPGPGAPSTPGGVPDVVDVLMADHRQIEELLTELESGSGTVEYRRRLADVAIAEIVRHDVAEQEYLYPAVRHVLPDGGATDSRIADQAEAEEIMKQLERVAATEPAFDRLVADLATRVRLHVLDEETDLLPRLRRSAAPAELRRLAVLVEMAERSAPTRPHPGAPHRPPWNLLLTPGAGLVDRVRDALRGRANDPADLRRPDPPGRPGEER